MKGKDLAALQAKLNSLLSHEKELRLKGYSFIAGVDEAGRGPLAGPVVASAVILPEHISLYGLDDSKKLSASKRETLALQIKKAAVAWSVSLATVCEIKWINKDKFLPDCADISADCITKEQLEKLYWWMLYEEPDRANQDQPRDKAISGYLPSYMRLLNNPDTEPSRMLRYIESRKKLSWLEVKSHLNETYRYSLLSGSLGASLIALEVLGCISIDGIGDSKIISFKKHYH